MGNNDFMLNIIAVLNKQLSKAQLKSDLKGIDNNLSVKVIAKLATALSKKQLGDSLKQLNNLYVQVGTKFKTDKNTRNKLLNEIEQLQKNLTELQLKVNVEKGASQNAVGSVISAAKAAQKYADKTSITLDVEVRKEKAVNDILYIGQKYSKLFSNLSASQKYENLLNSAYSISDKSQLQEVRAQISAFTSELKANGLATESTGQKWRKLIDRAKELFSAASIIRTVFVQAKQAVSTTIGLDKVYTDLVKVNDELNRNDYADYLSRCNQKAQELATTQKALIEGATEFSKSGYHLSTSDALTEKSTILSNVGDMSASDSAKAIISGVQAYDAVDGYTDVVDKAQALIDKYNEIGNTASITTAEIAQGVQKVGSVFADSNTSVDEFIALLSAGNRQFQDADNLSLGLRTAALRIRGCTSELEMMNEETEGVYTSASKLAEKIEGLTNVNGTGGVKILEADGETFRSIYDIFLDISKVYKDMSDTDASALLELIAGKNRASAISATLNNMSEAEEILQNSLNAAGSAQKEYDAYLQSTEAHIQQFQAKLVETYSTFVNGDMISHTADLGTAVLDLVNKTDLLKHSLIAITTLKVGQGISAVGGAISGTITQMNTLGNAIQQVKNLPLEDTLKTKPLIEIGEATQNLTEKNLRLLLSQEKLTMQDKVLILQQHNLTEEEAKSKLEKMGLTAATNANTAANTANATSANTLKGAFTGLTASVKATWAAMSALQKASIIFAAISTAWSIGSSIINGIKQSNEELVQSTQEAANSYKESASSIEDYASKYEELHKALIAAKGDEEETYAIKQQLLALQTELNDKFGDEYGAINLVTDAYKNQTEAIKALNKETAQTFLNENKAGTDKAEKEMTKDRHYNLSLTGISAYTDEGAALKEIAEKYKDQGVALLDELGDGSYAQFSVHLNADAQSAYDTINAFENDLRDKAKELGNEHMFDGVLDISSGSLNQAKETIDKYGDIFSQALTAEIASDDGLSDTYSEALKAVEDYNEAVLRSDNIYGDENVAKAKENLDTVRNSIEENEEEWGRYAALVDDVFGQADTRLLEFNEAMKNDAGLQNLANDLKGLSDLDLKAFDDTGDNASFEKLKESAKECNVSVDDLIDSLVRLGYVQGEIISGASDVEEPQWDFSETITQLDGLKDKFNVLDQTYAKLFDADTEIGFEDLSSINEAFKDLDGIDSFIQRLQEAGQDTESVTEVMQDLIAAYLDYSGILNNVTNENSALIEQFLTEMGIENAHEIVLAQLSGQTEALALQKQFLTEKGYELIDATLEETVQFLNEADASDEAKASIAQLALAKLDANNTVIDTSADIANVIALANAAGASATAVAKFKNAMAVIEDAKTKPVNGVGGLKQLDYAKSLKDSVESSTYDWEFQKLDARDFQVNAAPKYTPKYSGGSSTKKAVGDAAKDAEKAAEKAAKAVENQFEDMVDFFERRNDVLNDTLSLLKTNLDNVTGSFAKNNLIDAQLGVTEEKFKNYSDALNMYTQKANEALSKLPSDIAAKIKDGAVDLTTFVGDGNKEVVEAIKDYEQWADKVADCKQELAELRTAIRQFELDKFNNIMEDFKNQFDLHEDGKGLISKQIDLLKEAGQLIGESFFTSQIDQSKKQLELLENEKAQLVGQMNSAIGSGRVQKASDEWLEMVNALSDVEGNILDCKKAIEEFDNELLQLHWDVFDRIQGQFKDLDSELSNLRGLFDDSKVADSNFSWSKEALAQLGLLAQQYELAQYQVQQYNDEINQLNKDYLDGRYSATEYADKLSDLSAEQWEAVNASESIRDAIMDLNEVRIDEEITAIEKEISAFRDLIDAQIEALKSAKDLHDYQQLIAEKTKSVTDLERQIAAMANDDSAATVAKRKQLEEQLAQARKELEEAEYDHSIEAQEEALNKQYEQYEEGRNAEIEALRASLEEREQLIAESFEAVKQNADLIGQEITRIATEHGITVSNAIITSWQSGETAIASYGAVLSEQTSAFIGNLMGVEYEVYNLQAQANETANTLAWMFSTRADTLVGELASSYYSEQNLNYMTQALRDSLVKTLEGGYNISSITSALDSIAGHLNGVASAANNAASAISSVGAAQSGIGSGSNNSSSTRYYNTNTTKLPETVKGNVQFYTPKYVHYASGTRNAKGGLRVINEEGKELTLPKLPSGNYAIGNEGDQILTKEQTDNVYEWSKTSPDEYAESEDKPKLLTVEEFAAMYGVKPIDFTRLASSAMYDIPSQVKNPGMMPQAVNNNNSTVNVHYDSVVTVNGDVNDTKHFLNDMKTVADDAIKKSWHDFEMTSVLYR